MIFVPKDEGPRTFIRILQLFMSVRVEKEGDGHADYDGNEDGGDTKNSGVMVMTLNGMM